jgi:DNA-directed RNA polymerase specialized sigma24 family protein
MDELFWIQQLCSKNLADAKKAWKVLEPNIRNYLLQNPCPSYIEREDVISKSMVKIWRARAKWCELEEPKFESEAAWKSYVRAVGMNTLRDEISAFQRNELEREVAIAEVTKDSVEPSWPFEHSVCDYADAFWLKSDLKLSPIERAQRVLAAQFFYLHGESWQNVLSVISKRFNPQQNGV